MDPCERLGIDLRSPDFSATQTASAGFLDSNRALLLALKQSIAAYSAIEQLLPQTESKLLSGHTFPYFESRSDLENAIHLAFMGFYKHALVSVRSCLEMGLVCIYYDRDDDSEAVIGDWLRSREQTPFKKAIINGLRKIENVSALDFREHIIDSVEKHYDDLSGFVHTRGFDHSTAALNMWSSSFRESSLTACIDAACATVSELVILFLCKYPIGLFDLPIWEKFGLNPPFGGFIDPYQVAILRRVIVPPVLTTLSSICENDRAAGAVAESILALPDLTEDQLERQAEEIDQTEIKRNGFLSWYSHSAIAADVNHKDLGEYHRARLRKLEAWAKANGYYDKGSGSKGESDN